MKSKTLNPKGKAKTDNENRRSIRNIDDATYKAARKAAIDADMEIGKFINLAIKEKLERRPD